eukprot:symbB.v1.2.012571.t3/scaffold873.1/size155814/5
MFFQILGSHKTRAPFVPLEGSSEKGRRIWGLEEFLSELGLSEYEEKALKWAKDMGAISLEELVENAKDLGHAMGLKPLEQKRLERQGIQANCMMVLPVEGYQKAAGSMAFIVIVGIILVAKIGPSPVHLREDGERPPGHRVVVDDDVGDCDSAMRQAQQVSTLSQTPKAPLPSELPEASRLLNKIDVGAASSGRCPFGKVSKEVKNLAMAETQVKNTFIDVPSTATPIPSPPATAPARNAGATLKDSLQQAAEDIETAAPRNSTKNTPWKINIEHNHGGATHDPPALQPSARISGPAESASGSASGSADVGGRLEGTWVATAGRADSPQEAAPCDQMRGAQETGRKALPKEKWAAVIFAKRFLRYPPLNYQHSSHEAREMQKDINKHLAEWRLREQTEAEQAKKEKAAEKKRMNQELQRLRKEDRRSKLVEQETVRREEK